MNSETERDKKYKKHNCQ